MKVRKQVVNFEKGAVIALECVTASGKIYYVYPLIHIFPQPNLRFISYLPNDWFAAVVQSNFHISLDELRLEHTSIKGVMTLGIFQGLILSEQFYMPYGEVRDLETSPHKISLNFSSDADEILKCFERDRIYVTLLLMTMLVLRKRPIKISLEIDAQKALETYETVLSKYENNTPVVPEDFLIDNTMFVSNEEMKLRIEYLQTIESIERFLPQFQKEFPTESEINKLKITINKHALDLNKPQSVQPYASIDKETQLVYIDGQMLFVRKHKTLTEATDHLTTLKYPLPYPQVTTLKSDSYPCVLYCSGEYFSCIKLELKN